MIDGCPTSGTMRTSVLDPMGLEQQTLHSLLIGLTRIEEYSGQLSSVVSLRVNGVAVHTHDCHTSHTGDSGPLFLLSQQLDSYQSDIYLLYWDIKKKKYSMILYYF